MSESRYLRKGSKVTICLTPGDYAVTPGMLKYNGQTAAISKLFIFCLLFWTNTSTRAI